MGTSTGVHRNTGLQSIRSTMQQVIDCAGLHFGVEYGPCTGIQRLAFPAFDTEGGMLLTARTKHIQFAAQH